MPKWTQEGYLVVIFQDVKILPGERGSVERFIAHHNADIDALTAERDELQRRLDAVVEMLDMNTEPRPKHEDFHPFDHEQWNDAVCAWDRNASRYARAIAIAEGREG